MRAWKQWVNESWAEMLGVYCGISGCGDSLLQMVWKEIGECSVNIAEMDSAIRAAGQPIYQRYGADQEPSMNMFMYARVSAVHPTQCDAGQRADKQCATATSAHDGCENSKWDRPVVDSAAQATTHGLLGCASRATEDGRTVCWPYQVAEVVVAHLFLAPQVPPSISLAGPGRSI